MDFALFSALNQLTQYSPVVDWIAVFFATYALPIAIGISVIVGLKKKEFIMHALCSSTLAFSLNALIGFLYFRPRPFVDHAVIQLIEKSASQKSFPSDHATISFALAASVSVFFPRMSAAAYAIAIAISLFRVVSGVHYPSDIVAGAVVGVVSFLVIQRILRV